MSETDWGRLYFKEGLWSLYGTDEKSSTFTHLCRNKSLQMEQNPVYKGECSSCREKPPEGIAGINQLHNWDDPDGERMLHEALRTFVKEAPIYGVSKTTYPIVDTRKK